MQFENLIREDLRDFAPYASARSEKVSGQIWLNANELPWDNELEIQFDKINRYPEQQPELLLEKLAQYHKIETNKLIVTRGSDEGIDLLIRLFCNARLDSIAALKPTFGMYKVYAKIQGIEYIEIELDANNNYQLDINKIYTSINEQTKIIFLCHPNNPTGNLLNRADVLSLCEKLSNNCIIVVDEAYIEFAEGNGFANEINDYQNLVILRTMSKAFGLAAARIGILIANSHLISWLKKVLAPYPLAKPAVAEALAAMSDKNLQEQKIQIAKILSEREKLADHLKSIPIVKKIWPSYANFLLVEFTSNIMDFCLENGIVIRSMAKIVGSEKVFRISIGTPEEMAQLIHVLKEYK
jgi:histidinol-phosphate aminotransferase